jgi:magnesium chelatase subunit D
MAQRHLRNLPTGGKTPLPHALKLALELLQKEKARHPQDAFLLVLITDGRANLSMGGGPPLAEVKELAARLKTLGTNSLVLDTEAFAPCLDLGCLPELSLIMGGSYHSLSTLRAPEMLARIQAALGA